MPAKGNGRHKTPEKYMEEMVSFFAKYDQGPSILDGWTVKVGRRHLAMQSTT